MTTATNSALDAAALGAILAELDAMLLSRQQAADPAQSYVARLFEKGDDAILKKIGEEATETVLAAKDVRAGASSTQLVYECADLWFHSLIMLRHFDLSSADVLQELARRMGVSGFEEKARRKLQAREADGAHAINP